MTLVLQGQGRPIVEPARTIIVSNRLPISVSRVEGSLRVEASTGGLATGLAGIHQKHGGLWIGWPGHGESLTDAEASDLGRRYRELNVRSVELSTSEVERYYERFCNGVLWPLFHYLIGRLPLEVEDFDLYEAINRRFADAVVAEHRPGDIVWVHDYQLMFVPRLIRERIPEAAIGYFHHIPFPSSDVFRALPCRDQLLEGVLGADLIGFHTPAYVRNFASSALVRLGVSTDVDRLRWKKRTLRIGVFPMGVDAASFDAQSRAPDLVADVAALRRPDEVRLLVGIDRLDYTKGIPAGCWRSSGCCATTPRCEGAFASSRSRFLLGKTSTPIRSTESRSTASSGGFMAPSQRPAGFPSTTYSAPYLRVTWSLCTVPRMSCW